MRERSCDGILKKMKLKKTRKLWNFFQLPSGAVQNFIYTYRRTLSIENLNIRRGGVSVLLPSSLIFHTCMHHLRLIKPQRPIYKSSVACSFTHVNWYTFSLHRRSPAAKLHSPGRRHNSSRKLICTFILWTFRASPRFFQPGSYLLRSRPVASSRIIKTFWYACTSVRFNISW